MHKIGLKLWNTNTDFYLSEAQKLFFQKVFDYIELYIVPNNLDKLDKWKKLNIPFDIHAPHYAHGMNLSKKDFFESNLEKYLEVKKYADELNAEVIVFHGGAGGSYKETAEQLSKFCDNRIIIENKPHDTLDFVDENYYVGASFEEIKYIMKNAKCGFCLDIGHAICAANSFGINPYEYIEKFCILNPLRIHLSDTNTNTKKDMHLNYGCGNINFKILLNILPNCPITIETNKKTKFDLEDFKQDTIFLKKFLNTPR